MRLGFWLQIPHDLRDLYAEEQEEGFWHEKPHDLPPPPGLALFSTCLLPKDGLSAAALPPLRRCLPSDPSLRKACMLMNSPGPATRDLQFPLLPGPTRYLHLFAAQDQSCCCCSSPVLLPRTSFNRTTAGSWWWLSLIYAILASSYLFYCSPSLPHYPNP